MYVQKSTGDSAGRLIDISGLKGYRIGGCRGVNGTREFYSQYRQRNSG